MVKVLWVELASPHTFQKQILMVQAMITRVLISDDDPRITEIHQHYVNKVEGFEVIGLSNTLEDTEIQIRVMEPQLILLDIYFPDGNGIA